ncbi:hypothetical protein KGO06_00275 [Patescibacteria group bacterium]|nr:hypothetical protein [Patescibacteria group bacterium]
MYSVVSPVRERLERSGIGVLLACAYGIGIVILYGGFYLLNLSSVLVAFVTLAVFAFVPLIIKPWDLKGALLTGLMFGGFLFFFEMVFFLAYPGIVDAWWFGATWGRVLGVPYEEIIWGFLWGVAGASGTELVLRLRLRRLPRATT